MAKRTKNQSADTIALVPFGTFLRGAKKILSNSKRESDEQLAQFQVSNAKKRQAKKKR